MDPYLNTAFNAARKAANVIMQGYERRDKIKIAKKGPRDYVTNIDKDAENLIVNVLRTAYPSHAFITEEQGKFGQSDFQWVIDPIDGTHNYIHGRPHFAISIALMHNGRVEHGLIFDPVRDDLFTASRGCGAQRNGYRMRTSGRYRLSECIIGAGAPPFGRDDLFEAHYKALPVIAKQCLAMRHSGSAVLDLAYVAAGILDGCWQTGAKIWDYAAGSVILRESGALLADIDGSENYLKSGNIVAANPKVFNPLLKELQRFFKAKKKI